MNYLDPSNFTIDTFHPGNKSGLVPSAANGVIVKHIPTGLYATCDSDRSVHRNKHIAMEELLAKLKPISKPASEMTLEDFHELGKAFNLEDVELAHAFAARDVSYGDECIVEVGKGFSLRSPAFPADCEYYRICFLDFELAYWDSQEFGDNSIEVMGAVMGALKRN